MASPLLDHIRKLSRGRATLKNLLRERSRHGQSKAEVEAELARLIERGEIVEVRSGRYVAVGANSEYAVGKLNAHRDGYGFVKPETPIEGLDGDIYIGKHEAAKAMHGDRVVVRLDRVGYEGRGSGEIVKILKRAHLSVVGAFRVRPKDFVVVPHDDRIRQWIEIPEEFALPPRGAGLDRVGDKVTTSYDNITDPVELDGLIVTAEIMDFGEDGDRPVGKIIEVLGHPDDFGIDVEILIRTHHIPHRFPDEVIEAARAIPGRIAEDELASRRDFRDLEIVTIDGETARDFDDAVWVEPLQNGHWALQVHIADVSHYVRPDSVIDKEAYFRGTSVYFPDRSIPMLPIELSTDQCSLRPGEDRLVLSALMEIDARGDLVSSDFCRGVIRSAERMTYTAVHDILEDEGDAGKQARERYAPLVKRFGWMRDLAEILRRKRDRRGSIDFDLPEALLEFDEFGEMTGVARAPRNIAHRLIEEFMLAANEAVATFLEGLELPTLYRIHERPNPKRVLEFEEVALQFGYSLGDAATPEKRHRATTLAIDNPNLTSRSYQRLVAKLEGKPEERILNFLMLRSLKQARYSAHNEGHFALAAPSYTHFTSPIRRYPDLTVHRVLGAHLDGHQYQADMEEIADATSTTERRAAEAERDLVEWKKVKFMLDKVGEEFPALIVSTTRFGFFVELEDLFIEGLVPFDALHDDFYQYRENSRTIVGEWTGRQYSIGDQLRVRLDRADGVEKKLYFSPVESGQASDSAKKKGKAGKGRGAQRAKMPVAREGSKRRDHPGGKKHKRHGPGKKKRH